MLEIVACSPCQMSQANPCCSRAGGVRFPVDCYPCVCRKEFAWLGLVAVRKGVPGRQLTSRRPIPVCLSSDPGRWIELTTTCRARLNSLCYCSATQGSSGPRQSHPSGPGQAHRPNSRTSSSSRGASLWIMNGHDPTEMSATIYDRCLPRLIYRSERHACMCTCGRGACTLSIIVMAEDDGCHPS